MKISILLLSVLLTSCVNTYSLLAPIDSENCKLSISRIEFSFGNGYQYNYEKHLKDAGMIVLNSEGVIDSDTEFLSFSIQVRVNDGNTLKFSDSKIYYEADKVKMRYADILPFTRSDIVLK